MKRKDELEEEFLEYMASIWYDVPDEVTELDAIEMSLAHWRHNLETGNVKSIDKYCGLCQYFRSTSCCYCSLDRYEREHECGDVWKDGRDNGWRDSDVRMMIWTLEKTLEWVKRGE